MKSFGWLTGCALALACAHEGKGIVAESDTKMRHCSGGVPAARRLDGGRQVNPSVPRQRSGKGTRRPPPTHRGDAVA